MGHIGKEYEFGMRSFFQLSGKHDKLVTLLLW